MPPVARGPVPLWAVVSAGLLPVLLTSAWIVAGGLQSASYSPVRQTISVLAGQDAAERWIMTDALLFAGGCYLVTAAGLTSVRLSARLLLLVAAACSVGIALSPEAAGGPTVLHVAWTAVGAVTIAIWPALTAQLTTPRSQVVTVRGAALVTAFFTLLLGWVLTQIHGGSDLGLAERLAASAQTSWPFVVALASRRAARQSARAGDSVRWHPGPA